MGDVNADGEQPGPESRARFRVRCLVRCSGRIGLHLELGYISDVRARARLSFRVMVRHS